MLTLKRLALILTVSLLGAGCSTIHFQNGPTSAARQTHSEWHHEVAFRLFELSDPVDLNDRCDGAAWDTVTTEFTFLNWLAGAVDDVLLGVDVWTPWTVEYACRPAETTAAAQ